MVAIVAIVIVLGLLMVSGRTTLSRTSRAAAYVTLADLIEGKVWKRQAWPRALAHMLAILLIHALGLAVFVLLVACAVYLVLQRFGINPKSLL
jgi:cation transporter-like permease